MQKFGNSISRLVPFKNSEGQEARGSLLTVTRSTVILEVYNPYSVVQLSEVLRDLLLTRGDDVLYQGRAVVSSVVNTGLMLVVSATLVDAWRDFSLLVQRRGAIGKEIGSFIADWDSTKKVRPSYLAAVGDLRSFLTQLHLWLEQVDLLSEKGSSALPSVGGDIFAEIKQPLGPKIFELQQIFEHEAKAIGEDEIEAHRGAAQRDLLPLMMRAPFFFRSYTKPLGYAGDYMMVNMMIQGVREGPTTFAQIVNDFYLEIGLVKAHKNRLLILEERLTSLSRKAKSEGRKLRVLNIGCGPAIELQRFIKTQETAEACHFTLIDFNAETLAYAEECLSESMRAAGRRPEIKFVQESVHSLLKAAAEKNTTPTEKYDFIYCAGLFDYLSDRICRRLLQLFCSWSAQGGIVLATNVHPDNPTRWMMEHVVEWHLIHRTMTDLAALAPSELPHRIYDDETDLNVFVEIST